MQSLQWIAALVITTTAAPVFAQPKTVVKLSDPRDDDHGPGDYLYPSDTVFYPRGSFDMTELEVAVEGDEVLFTVTFAKNIARPFIAKRTNATQIVLDNSIYVQNVDIYIDTTPGRGIGYEDVVPGRNVTFDPDGAWDVAVVLTPQPYPTRSMLSEWRPGKKIVFATKVTAVGPKVTARVPSVELGGLPAPSWGYQALVTGAKWEPTFDIVNRFVQDRGPNAFTMMVQTVPETDAFGGGRLDYLHPFVIDLLAPPGKSQERILSSYDVDAQTLAVVPMVYPDPDAHNAAKALVGPLPTISTAPKRAPSTRWMTLPVRDVRDDMIILERADEAPDVYRLGEILDREGQAKCDVVVTSVHDDFVVATTIKCGEKVRRGDRVRFDRTAAKKTEGDKK